MLFANVTSEWVVLAQGMIAAAVTIVLAYLQMRIKTAVDKASTAAVVVAETAATKVEEVKKVSKEQDVKLDQIKEVAVKIDEAKEVAKAQDVKLDAIGRTADKVHDLVNSASLVQMRLYAQAARRIADLTGEPADEEAALTAEKLFKEHSAKQEAVTRKG